MKSIYLVNADATFSNKVISFLKSKDADYYICHVQDQLSSILKKKIKEGYDSFIVSGGDGTINNFINAYMNLPKSQRAKIKFGVLPSGKANDLARELGFSRDFYLTNNKIKNEKIRELDIIRVNNKFFITGGGFGLPVDVVLGVNSFSKRYYHINRVIKDLVYYFFVLKSLLFSYEGVSEFNIDGKKYSDRYMLLSVLNQSFIGKRFNLSPHAINSDGLMDICIVLKSKFLRDLSMVNKIVKGIHVNDIEVKVIRKKEVLIKTKKKMYFMGDGELLVFSDTFKFKVIPKAIRVFH